MLPWRREAKIAKLPSKFDLSGPESLRSGRAIASQDTTGGGRGLAAFGQDVSAIGANLQQEEEKKRRELIALEGTAADGQGMQDVSALERGFDSDTDYGSFQKRFDDGVAKIREQRASAITDPKARALWSAQFHNSANSARNRVIDLGVKRQREGQLLEAKTGLEGYQSVIADTSASENDRTLARRNAEGSIGVLESQGLLTPAEAEEWRDKVVTGGEFIFGQRLIERNGSAAIGGQKAGADIFSAMRSVESSNDPNAVSGAGAIGLMQVMPGTAAEIASEIGDANFPRTPEAQAEYLKRPEVSKRYGEHYYNKMVDRYDGDVEAALIAYNGGPKRADEWLAAGRDDSAIPAESAAYYKKVLTKAGQSNFSDTFDANANSFLKSRLVGHTPDHIDNLRPEMQNRLAALINAAPPGIREKLGIFSGARSVERQAELWHAAVKKYGSEKAARKWVAPPGESNHNDGEAVDLSYDGKSLAKAPPEVVKWLHDNAAVYDLKFPLDHENWHIELAETRGGRPDWFKRLPPQDQYRLEQQAAAQDRQFQTARDAQAAADRAAVKDDFLLRIANSDTTLTRGMILNSEVLDNGDKASLINSYNEKMKDALSTAEAMKSFASGGLQVDPYDEKGRKVVDNLADALVTARPESAQPLVEELVRQTGVVPRSAMSAMRQGATSQNTQEVLQAAQSAQRISMVDGAALERRDGGAAVQKLADTFTHYVNDLNLSPDEAARRIAEANDPAKALQRKAIEPAAKEFIKEMQKVDLVSEFDDRWTEDPQIGFSASQALGIQADFLAIAEDQFFKANGDPELAKANALREMKRLYGVTDITGRPVVMKHPPEKHWPKSTLGTTTSEFDGPFGRRGVASLDYARQQLAADVQAMTPDADMSSVQLVTTPETDAMVKRGELPGYAVLYKDASGVLQTVPGKLWKPDVAKAGEWTRRAEQQRIDDARKEQVQERLNALSEERQRKLQAPYLGGADPVFGDRDGATIPAPPADAPVIDGSSDLLEPTPGSAM